MLHMSRVSGNAVYATDLIDGMIYVPAGMLKAHFGCSKVSCGLPTRHPVLPVSYTLNLMKAASNIGELLEISIRDVMSDVNQEIESSKKAKTL